jgi:hypothetical protein
VRALEGLLRGWEVPAGMDPELIRVVEVEGAGRVRTLELPVRVVLSRWALRMPREGKDLPQVEQRKGLSS